jgi:hypothetical protein
MAVLSFTRKRLAQAWYQTVEGFRRRLYLRPKYKEYMGGELANISLFFFQFLQPSATHFEL